MHRARAPNCAELGTVFARAAQGSCGREIYANAHLAHYLY